MSYHNKDLVEKQEEFMRRFVGTQCTIEIDEKLVFDLICL